MKTIKKIIGITVIIAMLCFLAIVCIMNSCKQDPVDTLSSVSEQQETSSSNIMDNSSVNSEDEKGSAIITEDILQLPDGNLVVTCNERKQLMLFDVDTESYDLILDVEDGEIYLGKLYNSESIVYQIGTKGAETSYYAIVDINTKEITKIGQRPKITYDSGRKELFEVGESFETEEREGYTAYLFPESLDGLGDLVEVLGRSKNKIIAIYSKGKEHRVDETDEPLLRTIIAYDLDTGDYELFYQSSYMESIIMPDEDHIIIDSRCYDVSDFSIYSRIDYDFEYVSNRTRSFYVDGDTLMMLGTKHYDSYHVLKYNPKTNSVEDLYNTQERIEFLSPWKDKGVLFVERESYFTPGTLLLLNEDNETTVIAENVEDYYICGYYIVTISDGLLNRIEIE